MDIPHEKFKSICSNALVKLSLHDIDLETGHTHDLEYQLTDGAQLARYR